MFYCMFYFTCDRSRRAIFRRAVAALLLYAHSAHVTDGDDMVMTVFAFNFCNRRQWRS